MHEAAPIQKNGLSPTFNLGKSILSAHETTDIISTAAADKVAGNYEEQLDTLEHKANHDHLTGLLNQSAYMDRFTKTIESLDEEDSATLYIADLDGFKGINDELGHPVGDELLALVGEAFRKTFQRGEDTAGRGSREDGEDDIARLGGDEFAAFTVRKASGPKFSDRTTTPEEESALQAIRLNTHLQELLTGTKFAVFSLKLSVGTAERQPNEDAISLFARADLNMFKVKYEGKIDRLTEEDKVQLQKIIPYLESKGARVEAWLKVGAGLLEAA